MYTTQNAHSHRDTWGSQNAKETQLKIIYFYQFGFQNSHYTNLEQAIIFNGTHIF
jgi:hypothetical protein